METTYQRTAHRGSRCVFSLPMRDGNKLKALSLHRQLLVFSLPMRDGNGSRLNKLKVAEASVFSLPMRDGNEK